MRDLLKTRLFETFCLWVIFVYLVAFLGYQLFPKEPVFGKTSFTLSLSNWDGGHYLGIAQNGYINDSQYAFFPLYPILIRAVTEILGSNYYFAALFVSLVSMFGNLVLFRKLLKIDYPQVISKKAFLYWLFFPTSFFLLAAYSESLFVFFALGAIYFARKKMFLLASIFAIFSGLTKFFGVAVVLALWYEAFVVNGFKKGTIPVLLAPLGLIAYSGYLVFAKGDPLFFLAAQSNWHRVLSFPGIGVWQSWNSIFSNNLNIKTFLAFLEIIFFIFGVGLIFRSFRFIRRSYFIYSVSVIAIPLFTPTLMSINRFLVLAFPMFIVIALVKKKWLTISYIILSLSLLAVYLSLYINGFWVG